MLSEEQFDQFVQLHKPQLTLSGVPPLYWRKLFEKLTLETFDGDEVFHLIRIEYDDDNEPREAYDPIFQLRIKASTNLSSNDPSSIYLVDHAWTFRLDSDKQILHDNDKLLQRMSYITGIHQNNENESKDEFIERVFQDIWRYVNTYSVPSAMNAEDRVPIWYVMDEVGSAMIHSDDPNFKMVPFIFITQGITYSLIFPLRDCEPCEIVSRNHAESKGVVIEEDLRKAKLLPWVYSDFIEKSFQHVNVSPDYFLGGHIEETLPIINKSSQTVKDVPNESKPLKVFSQYKFVNEYLTSDKFQVVFDEDEADVLWYTSHFKKFEELQANAPHKFINQFPFEYVLTTKDLLCVICRRNKSEIDVNTLEVQPKWLPVTYNLTSELVQFVSYFKNRALKGLDNHWIVKPFNLARGLDTHITKNLNCIIRLASSGPKVVQKYIDRPVLFARNVGKVKFDIRYVILLKSVQPLNVYVYNNFFLRFANMPYSLSDLHIYEKHFTVMNYNAQAVLKHMHCAEFITKWDQQFSVAWSKVEKSILAMLREVFDSAVNEPPPCGISESPQSRSLYAADIMLEYKQNNDATNENKDIEEEMIPKLLEINWMPDCKRACEYYSDFYNDIFKLLFLDMENDDVFTKL